MIQARSLTKRYGSRPAIVDVSLDVEPGEVVLLSGASGSGRTTLLRILATRSRPDSGTLRIDGADALASPRRAQRSVRYLPESPVFYEELTVREQLNFVARCREDVSAAEAAVDVQLTFFALERDRDVGSLSAGHRQRLALACTLLGEPRIVLLDEPTGTLDPWARARLAARLETLSRAGAAAIVASNDVTALWSACHRVAILHEGSIRKIAGAAGTGSDPGAIMKELSTLGG